MPERALEFPSWAVMRPRRQEHVARVAALLDTWARAMRVNASEADRWREAARLHDALRDANAPRLRRVTGDRTTSADLLHGPAAAILARRDGERRVDVLEAVRYHTVGRVSWARTGRALYMADFLEPGRRFLVAERRRLAARVPRDFDGAFRDVVCLRLRWTLDKGGILFPETVRLWHAVR